MIISATTDIDHTVAAGLSKDALQELAELVGIDWNLRARFTKGRARR